MSKKRTSKPQKEQKPVETAALSLAAHVRPFNEVKGRREVLGFADLTIGKAFVIKGISIVRVKPEGSETYGAPFVSFPQRKGGDDKYFDLAHPTTAEAHKQATEAILSAYQQAAAVKA